jgi:hypothetical protein
MSLQAITTPQGFRVRRDEALIEVTGDDAASWLQGQLTNDVRNAQEGTAVYALVIDVKGKVISDLWVYRWGDDAFLLAVPVDRRDPVIERLDAFVIMEDVELAPRPDLVTVSVLGDDEAVDGAALPEGIRMFASERFPGCPGQDWILDEGDLDACRAALRRERPELDEAAWERLRLASGAPRFGVDFDHRHFPQEAGLRDRAVSFDKGCYLGQEVVCMLEMRGKLKRRLVRVRGDGPPGERGARLVSEDDRVVGALGSSAEDPHRPGTFWAFALLEADLARPGGQVRAGDAVLEVVDG